MKLEKNTKELFETVLNSAVVLFFASAAWAVLGLGGITGIPSGLGVLIKAVKSASWFKGAVEWAMAGAAFFGLKKAYAQANSEKK